MQGRDKYIRRYPENELVQILKDSGYHSEEWEETDDDDATSIVVIYERWWRSPAVRLFILLVLLQNIMLILFIYLSFAVYYTNELTQRLIL